MTNLICMIAIGVFIMLSYITNIWLQDTTLFADQIDKLEEDQIKKTQLAYHLFVTWCATPLKTIQPLQMSAFNKSVNVPGFSKQVQGAFQEVSSCPTLDIKMTLAEVQSSVQHRGEKRQTDDVDKRGASFLDTEAVVDEEEDSGNEVEEDELQRDSLQPETSQTQKRAENEKSRDKGSWYLEAGGPGLNRECPNRDYQGGKNTQRQPGPFVIKKGHHSGDITQVININSETMCSQANCIDVMVVPRVCKLGWDKISFPIIVKAHMQLPDPALFGALELRGKFRLSVATDVNNSNTNAMEIPGHRMHQVRKENQSRRFLNRFLILTLGIANVGSEVVRAFLHAGSQAEMEIKQKQWVQSLTPGTPVFYRNNTRIMVDTVIEKITVGEQTGNPLDNLFPWLKTGDTMMVAARHCKGKQAFAAGPPLHRQVHLVFLMPCKEFSATNLWKVYKGLELLAGQQTTPTEEATSSFNVDYVKQQSRNAILGIPEQSTLLPHIPDNSVETQLRFLINKQIARHSWEEKTMRTIGTSCNYK
ncbi:hypothetical protein BDV98DRAFT_582277 [Pterulicium gracile]|uniref:Uncharacterized protein n=1 Tax=Pterulicium gracile TaxID=1884261 RepID=A0A5C3QIM2_9AGAR|nr:hypothetical protein BDV98DRAFT_582277 [Pterula gracilis]